MEIICNVCLGSGLAEDYTLICPHCNGQGVIDLDILRLEADHFNGFNAAYIKESNFDKLPESDFTIHIFQRDCNSGFRFKQDIRRLTLIGYYGEKKRMIYFDEFKMNVIFDEDKYEDQLIFQARVTKSHAF